METSPTLERDQVVVFFFFTIKIIEIFLSLQRCFSTFRTYSVTTFTMVADSTERLTEPHYLVRFLFYKMFLWRVFCVQFWCIPHSNILCQELYDKLLYQGTCPS